ncbi:MAG: hypothetical protein ACE5NG_08555, partial [bacterium]
DAQEFLSAFEKNQNKVFAQMAREVGFPKVKTVIASMVVDDVGNLWVATHETREENTKTATAYDIFDPDGVYIAKVWLTVRSTLFV